MKIQKNCCYCNKEFSFWPSENRKYCSKSCMGKAKTGNNNPNFGKTWCNDQKLKQSKLIKSKVDDRFRLACAKANKNKKFDKNRIDKMHKNRTKNSYVRVHTENTKKIIGEKSKLKFTPEFKERIRIHNESTGLWIPHNKKSDFKIYQEESHWIDNMWNYANKDLLESCGIFNVKHNKNGLVRDHSFSKFDGFNLQIYPEILRHPANLNFITHNQNCKKRINSNISHLELFEKIKNFIGNWQEHKLVLQLITDWTEGKRMNIQIYRDRRNKCQIESS